MGGLTIVVVYSIAGTIYNWYQIRKNAFEEQ
jgi:hypothetical protein